MARVGAECLYALCRYVSGCLGGLIKCCSQSVDCKPCSTQCTVSQVVDTYTLVAWCCMPDAGRQMYSVGEVATAVVGMMDKMGMQQACVVAHSYGA